MTGFDQVKVGPREVKAFGQKLRLSKVEGRLMIILHLSARAGPDYITPKELFLLSGVPQSSGYAAIEQLRVKLPFCGLRIERPKHALRLSIDNLKQPEGAR